MTFKYVFKNIIFKLLKNTAFAYKYAFITKVEKVQSDKQKIQLFLNVFIV